MTRLVKENGPKGEKSQESGVLVTGWSLAEPRLGWSQAMAGGNRTGIGFSVRSAAVATALVDLVAMVTMMLVYIFYYEDTDFAIDATVFDLTIVRVCRLAVASHCPTRLRVRSRRPVSSMRFLSQCWVPRA